MSKSRLVIGFVIILGIVGAAVLAPAVVGQGPRERDRAERRPGFQLPFDGGSRIGASVRDLDDADVSREKLAGPAGALIERLDTDGPAGRAGLRAGDVVVEFDGERIRSAMQLTRLVRETPEGRAVKVTVVRGGARMTMDVTPVRRGPFGADESLWREPLRNLEELGRNFDFDVESMMGWGGRRGRLGVSVQPLTPQLATYFGVADGLLVSSVAEESSAARAGIKAGDVITLVNGKAVASYGGLMRVLRDAGDNAEVSLEISRDRKNMTMKVQLDRAQERRPMPRGRAL